MRTTINLDDDLLATAARLMGITDRTALIRESLKAIIARESARRLALLGGSQPDFEVPPRRRSESAPRAARTDCVGRDSKMARYGAPVGCPIWRGDALSRCSCRPHGGAPAVYCQDLPVKQMLSGAPSLAINSAPPEVLRRILLGTSARDRKHLLNDSPTAECFCVMWRDLCAVRHRHDHSAKLFRHVRANLQRGQTKRASSRPVRQTQKRIIPA